MTNSPINRKQLNSNCSNIYNWLLLGYKASLFSFKSIKNIHSRFYDIRKFLKDNYGVELKSEWIHTNDIRHKIYWLTSSDIHIIKKGIKINKDIFNLQDLKSLGFKHNGDGIYCKILDNNCIYFFKNTFELNTIRLNIKTISQLKNLIKIL